MRTLVIGDIHGALIALQQVLQRAQITPKDHLIFLGDYADGWSQTPQVLDFLIQYPQQHHCTFLRGNHDALCYDFLCGKTNDTMWYLHGGKATVKAYENISENTKEAHRNFLFALEDYYLDDDNRLFLHAGFTNLRGVAYEYFTEMLYWDRTLWETACSTTLAPAHPQYPTRLRLYKQIYIGHTPTTRLGSTHPLTFHNVTTVDTGAAFKGVITILDIDNNTYWQSDPVYTLYPQEQGRNTK